MAAKNSAGTTSSPLSAIDPLKKTAAVWLALIAFSFPVSIAASSVVLFSFLGFYLLAGRWTLRRWPPQSGEPRQPGGPPTWGGVEKTFVVFFIISLLSATLSESPLRSRGQLAEDLYFLLVPVLCGILVQELELRSRLFKVFLWGGVFTALFGLLQYAIGIDRNPRDGMEILQNVPQVLADWAQSPLKKLSLNDGRATGLRSHPLTFAETLLFPLAYLLSRMAYDRLGWKQIVAGGILLLAFLFSKSRGPWIAFAVMTFALALWEPRKPLLKKLIMLWIFPVVLIFSVPTLRNRLFSIGDTRFSSNTERLMMWQAGGQMLKDHPLLGVGPGHVRRVSVRYQTPEQNAAFGAWGHLHNTYVQIGAERGFLGLIAFLFFLGYMGKRLWNAYRQAPQTETDDRIVLLTALLAGVGWLMSGLTEAVYNNSSIQMMFYFVMGVGLAAAKNYCKT